MNDVQEEIQKITNGNNDTFVLDFYADWCAPCKVLARNIDSIKDKYTSVEFKKINVDKESKVASIFEIRNLPTLLFIKDQKVQRLTIGAISEYELKNILNDLLTLD